MDFLEGVRCFYPITVFIGRLQIMIENFDKLGKSKVCPLMSWGKGPSRTRTRTGITNYYSCLALHQVSTLQLCTASFGRS